MHTRRAFAFTPRLVEAKGFPEPVRAHRVEQRLEHPEKVRGVEGLRAAGLSYRELEERGYGIVVVEVLAHYRRAAFFDDELTLRTELADLSRASMRFEYEVSRDGELLVTGHTRHACVDLATGKPIRVPEEVLAAARKAS